jgi:CheY-like chemotaxis protein
MPCGGELSFTLDKVEFAAGEAVTPRRPGVFARITISDTGHGMPPEVLARLQQPFFTTHADREMGLGLFAVNEILALHYGWLEVESQKAKGTRVHVFLPARPPATRPEPLAQDALLLQQKKLEGTERLLVVEPDPATLMLLKAVLGYRGYQVQAAGSGQEALQAVGGAAPVQLLLVDMNLPDMTAWQLMNQLRHTWPGLKVIFLVQETTPDLLSLAQRVQASLLTKPIENQRLLSLIRECLEKAG